MKKLLLMGGTILTTFVVKQILEKGWERAYKEPAPNNPAHSDTSWGKAIVWTLATSALIGMSDLVVRKNISEKYRK